MYFITGSQGKFEEAKRILPDLKQLDIDLPEIQEMDPQAIIKAKLQAAFEHHQGPFMVEDTSLSCEGLGGLPGPLIKWFLKALGPSGTAKLALQSGNTQAVARTCVGYAQNPTDIHFFEGTIAGTIVAPRGEFGFGWDSIFLPDGFTKTFGEMTRDQKQEISMRAIAVGALKDFLTS